METTKVVVTNWGALLAKYGEAGLARVRKAIDALVAADAQRGIQTRVIGMDAAREMQPFRAQPVRGEDDIEGAKNAVDAIDRRLLPHYILILGGPDVVPMQQLENFSGVTERGEDGDLDKVVDSDLPYACDMPFSRDPADFQGPARAAPRTSCGCCNSPLATSRSRRPTMRNGSASPRAPGGSPRSSRSSPSSGTSRRCTSHRRQRSTC